MIAAAELDPEAGSEALIGFEVTDVGDFDGGRRLQAEGLLLFVASSGPGDSAFAGDFPLDAVDNQLQCFAFAFIERGAQDEAFARDKGGQIIGLDA